MAYKQFNSLQLGKLRQANSKPREQLSFGVDYLDKATEGIDSNDLVLVGAESGSGKTQFCANLARVNAKNHKLVHMIALEAYEGEIEDRIFYTEYAKAFYSDPERPVLQKPLSFKSFAKGHLRGILAKYDEKVNETLVHLANMSTTYIKNDFTLDDVTDLLLSRAALDDLIIIDHAHYFDYENESENIALKKIAKEIRNIALYIGKPVVLVAHLRKSDRRFKEVAPGRDEFHGSSDLTKIATKIVTLARGNIHGTTGSETYIRIPKDRYDGSLAWYIGKTVFDFKKNEYSQKFQLGRISNDGKEFIEINKEEWPAWAK